MGTLQALPKAIFRIILVAQHQKTYNAEDSPKQGTGCHLLPRAQPEAVCSEREEALESRVSLLPRHTLLCLVMLQLESPLTQQCINSLGRFPEDQPARDQTEGLPDLRA